MITRQGKEKKCRDQGPRETKSETHLFFNSFLLVFSFLIPGFGVFFLIVGGREIRWDGGGGVH